MATALDVVGDRWALLVVRELLLGPRRFGELLDGLGGIGTDILTARLRQLEGCGVLARSGTGRQQRYGLTGCGRALRPVLVELARWGSYRLGVPDRPEEIPVRVALTALVIDPPGVPAGLTGTYEITAAGETAHLRIAGGAIEIVDTTPVAAGADGTATVIELARPGLLGLLIGSRAHELARRGDLAVRGNHRAGMRLADALRAPKILAGLLIPRP